MVVTTRSRRVAPATPFAPPADGQPRAAFTGIASLILPAVMSLLVPLFLVTSVENVGRSHAWIVTLGIMVYAGVRLSLLAVRGEARLFDFFFWLFVYIFLGLGPTVQIRVDVLPITTPQVDPGLDMPAAVVTVVGLVVYEIGHLAAISRKRARGASPQRDERPLGVREWATIILVGVSMLSAAYYVFKIGPGNMLALRSQHQAARVRAFPDPAFRSIAYGAAIFPLLVAAGALAQIRKTGSTATWRRGAGFGMLAVSAMCLYVANPLASARYTFGTVAFALLVYLGAVSTMYRIRFTMIGTLLGFLFLFPLADSFRNTDQATFAARNGFFGEYPGNGDYDSLWQIASAYSYWQDGQVVPLRQFMGSVLFWVPRQFWADKPTDTGIVLAQYRGLRFTNLSAPLWAEGLVNGGLIGLILLFLALGYVIHRMDDKLTQALRLGGAWGIAGAIFPVYMVILLRGSLLQATGALVISITCVLWVRERRPRSRPPQDR